MTETKHPIYVRDFNGALYVYNGPLMGPGGQPNRVTSRPGPRPPIQTPQGTTGSDHAAYDLVVDERLIPGKEAPVVSLLPWHLLAAIWEPTRQRGIMTVLEHPPLSDGRRVFSRALHMDPDVAQNTNASGVKGEQLGAMGETGLAVGEHLHQEIRVEIRPGLIASMVARGASLTDLAGGGVGRAPSGRLEVGVRWVDWLTEEWLAYINSFEWGAGWPAAPAPVETSRLDLRNRIIFGAYDAWDQRTLPEQLSVMEEVPEPPPGWDHEYRLLTRATA